MKTPNSTLTLRLASVCLVLLLGACGMKGPLQPAASPPPPDATLMTPPSVSPAAAPAPVTKP